MAASALCASAEAKACYRRAASHTVRVLIHVSGGSTLLPATTRLVLTSGSGAPFAEVVLNWGNAEDDEVGLRAVLEALKIARRYRARRVVVYIDNVAAASIAAGEEKAPPALVGLALQIRALAHTYRLVEVRPGMSLVAPTLPDIGGDCEESGGEEPPGELMREMGETSRQWSS